MALDGTSSLHTRAGAFDATRRQLIKKPTGLKPGWNPNKWDATKRQAIKALKSQKWHRTTDAAVTEALSRKVKGRIGAVIGGTVGTLGGAAVGNLAGNLVQPPKGPGHGSSNLGVAGTLVGAAYGGYKGAKLGRKAGRGNNPRTGRADEVVRELITRAILETVRVTLTGKPVSGMTGGPPHGIGGLKIKAHQKGLYFNNAEPPNAEPTDGGSGPTGRTAHANL